jgi:hypothetical protein
VNDFENALIYTEVEHRLWLSKIGFRRHLPKSRSGDLRRRLHVARKALPEAAQSGTAIIPRTSLTDDRITSQRRTPWNLAAGVPLAR